MRSRILTGVLAAGVLVLAACGGSSKAFNDADAQFAQGMIPHHQQAVEMADLALSKAASPKVKDLAVRIKAAQDPEIQQMTAWLKAWGKPFAGSSDMAGMDHGSGSTSDTAMAGMMTAENMATLQSATGGDFDTRFLEMMVRHHQGAIDMAKTEQAKGRFADAKTLASSIVTSQQPEIDEMNTLLGKA